MSVSTEKKHRLLRFELEKTESGKELAVKMPHVHVHPVALDIKHSKSLGSETKSLPDKVTL